MKRFNKIFNNKRKSRQRDHDLSGTDMNSEVTVQTSSLRNIFKVFKKKKGKQTISIGDSLNSNNINSCRSNNSDNCNNTNDIRDDTSSQNSSDVSMSGNLKKYLNNGYPICTKVDGIYTKEVVPQEQYLTQKMMIKYEIYSDRMATKYKGYFGNSNFSKEASLKLEKANKNGSKINREAKVLKHLRLNKCLYMVEIIGLEQHKNFNILIQNWKGIPLDIIFQRHNKKFSMFTCMHILIKMVECLQSIHKYGIVHQKICLSSIVLNTETSRFFLTDFSDSGFLVDKYNNHIPKRCRKTIYPVSHPLFVSINGHRGMQQTRRDDFISLLYLIIYLHRGFLPWEEFYTDNHSITQRRKIYKSKRTVSKDLLFYGMPNHFYELHNQIHDLKYSQQPNYNSIIKIFTHIRNKIAKKASSKNKISQFEWHKQV